jgi:hypothetical protein
VSRSRYHYSIILSELLARLLLSAVRPLVRGPWLSRSSKLLWKNDFLFLSTILVGIPYALFVAVHLTKSTAASCFLLETRLKDFIC